MGCCAEHALRLLHGTFACTEAAAATTPCLISAIQVNLHVFGFEMLAPTDLGTVDVRYRWT
jgi:hypothetical protein